MTIELTAEDKVRAERLVASGRFSSIAEVVHASIAVVEEEERWKAQAREKIQAGVDAIDRGDIVEQQEVEETLKSFMRKTA